MENNLWTKYFDIFELLAKCIHCSVNSISGEITETVFDAGLYQLVVIMWLQWSTGWGYLESAEGTSWSAISWCHSTGRWVTIFVMKMPQNLTKTTNSDGINYITNYFFQCFLIDNLPNHVNCKKTFANFNYIKIISKNELAVTIRKLWKHYQTVNWKKFCRQVEDISWNPPCY